MVGAVTSRAEAQTLRLALIYALLDGSDDVSSAHVKAALAVWKYCEQSAMFLFGTTLGDPVADIILQALLTAPNGLTRTEIRNLFNRHKDADEIGRALKLLEEREQARCEKQTTRGRPEERWYVEG